VIAIVVSRADEASEHVGEHLLDAADWTEHHDDAVPDAEGGATVYRTDGFELRTFDALHLEIADAADPFDDPNLLVFASRHSGDTGPLLTAHYTGNFGAANYGGTDGDLARACPGAHRRVVDAFDEYAPDGYAVGVECTHHGPSRVGVPSMFVELGSGEDEWADAEAARAVADSILALRGAPPAADKVVVGFGGGHYAPRFERVLRETDWSLGHVAADWGLDDLGDPHTDAARETLRQAFEGSGTEYALVDGDHPALEAAIEDLGYRVVGETWLRAADDRPLAVVDALEDRLSPVAEGLRFGEVHVDGPDTVSVVPLPGDLLAEAQGVDADASRAAVEAHTVGFETSEGGTRASGRAAVATAEARERLVNALADVLRDAYDSVTVDGDAVVAEETAFDPALASDAGVPEGPAFGKLANGEPVEGADGRVDPEDVTVERTRRFHF
jgi:D-aminoacyl-tRNA deacylase